MATPQDFTSTWFSDTDPDTLNAYIEIYRNMSESQRLQRTFELCDMQFAMQQANVREMYPQASEREVFLRVAARRLDRDDMIRAYNWDPEQHP